MNDEQAPTIETQVAALHNIGVHIPLTREQAEPIKGGFPFRRSWTCTTLVDDETNPGQQRPCGASLTVSSEHDHAEGQSNFVVHKTGKSKGHSKLDQSELNWEGLREERGWLHDGDQIQCPACQAGMTVTAFKEMKRREAIEAQIAALQAELGKPVTQTKE
jgi:hypothetical protein